MKNTNFGNILLRLLAPLCLLLSVSCEHELYRDDTPMLEFDTDYTTTDNYVTVGKDVSGTNAVLSYRNGYGRTVELDIENVTGIYADKKTVTLGEDKGIIELPLKGSCKIEGLAELKVRIKYDKVYIFCPFRIGVRPEEIGNIEITDKPQLSGVFLQDIESEAYVTVNYINAWGRSLTARFECEDEGISTAARKFTLNPDGSAGSIKVPITGRPAQAHEIEATMLLDLEDTEENLSYTFTFDINEPIPFKAEEVKQFLIVTDRNELIKDAASLEVREFTYNTVFVDMNGDGYVTDNHEIWLDRNVGATSTDINSEDSYGFIYQAARNSPGYIKNSQNGGYWNGEMKSVSNFFWYNGSGNAASEAGVSVTPKTVGPKNPCPQGYRMPTTAEFERLVKYLGTSAEAYTGAPLFFPLPGEFFGNTAAERTNVGKLGSYWSAPVANGGVISLIINGTAASNANIPAAGTVKAINRTKGSGCSIRCVKAKAEELAEYSYSANPTEALSHEL